MSALESQFIVYGLVDPRNDNIRYIGKSINGLKRPKEHSKPSNLKNDGNTRKANWIRSLLKLGLKPKISILYTLGNCSWSKNDINECLYKKEHELIEYYNILGYDLTNAQDGGPGSTGRKLSEESLKKMSESGKKRQIPQALKDNWKPKFNDPESKRICSICLVAKDINEISHGKKTRHCKDCFNKNRKSRIIPGAKQKADNDKCKKVKAINIITKEQIIFKGFRPAAKIIGGKCSKSGIRLSIKKNRPYYNYVWSII